LIHNNTVFITNASPTPAALLIASATTNTRIHNNIFQTTGGALLTWISSGQNGLLMQGNDYWSTGASVAIVDSGVTYSSLTNWSAATLREKLNGTNTGLNLDPKLVSPGGGGTFNDAILLPTLAAYELQTNSPMVDTGLNLPKLGLNVGTRDFFGVSVAQGIGFDIGASETRNPTMIKGAWTALTNTTSVIFQFTDTNSSRNSIRFYRVR
jgi:hypothetical protein